MRTVKLWQQLQGRIVLTGTAPDRTAARAGADRADQEEGVAAAAGPEMIAAQGAEAAEIVIAS